MTISDILDWILRLVVVLGIPGVVTYMVKERRKTNAESRSAEANAEVDEAQVPLRVKSSSIVTLESEIAALSKTFQDDRKLKEDTIAWLREQLEQERQTSAAKDQRIRDLEEKVQALQQRVAEVSEELARVSEDLKSLHGDQH